MAELLNSKWITRIGLALLILIPVSIILAYVNISPVVKFIVSALAIIPLAGIMGRSTEHLSSKVGAGLSSFLNASFGNAAELIIGFSALRAGLHEIVKASITGAIIGNVLLVVGISFLLGGLKYKKQEFNRTTMSIGATLLLLSAIGLVVPALYHSIALGQPKIIEQELSLEIAIVLFIVYILSLLFTFRTHKHLYVGQPDKEHHNLKEAWGTKKAISILLISTGFIILVSENLVAAIEPAAHTIGMSEIFVGVILVAIIGNAVEHFAAIPFALKDNMDVSLGIAVGGSQQIALFVAPVLVFLSYLVGQPMDLLFSMFEVAAVLLAVLVINFVAADGESNWMEGVLLLSVYVILAIAFYFLP